MLNLRLAPRSLRKTPLVSAVAVLSLALGIGANAAIFSLFERLLLQPLPVPQPNQLVNLTSPGPKQGSISSGSAGGSDSIFSYAMFRDLESLQTSFTGVAAHRPFGANVGYRGETESAAGLLVSGSYFEVLGLQPAAGRLFSRDDDLSPGAHPLIVLSHAYWTTRFNADPKMIGSPAVLNGQPVTVLGVAPPRFRGTTAGGGPAIFLPLTMSGTAIPGWDAFENRKSYSFYVFARLAADETSESAAAAISIPYRSILQEVEAPLQSMSDDRLAQFRDKTIVLEPGYRGQSQLFSEARPPLILLLSVTGFVLLIASANVANLLLTKAINRSSEIAIQLSLGASRSQLFSQLLAEAALLAILGGVLGVFVAQLTLQAIRSLMPADAHVLLSGGFGPSTWVFLAVLTVVTALAGLFPAVHGSRAELISSLRAKSGQAENSRSASRFRGAMATIQVALAMALLISAGLFARSLLNVSRVDLGIETRTLATFSVAPELNGYTPAASRAFFERVEDAVGAIPGVNSVAASMVPLISGSNWGSSVSVQGFPSGQDIDTQASFNEIGPGYFHTLGVAMLAGREFAPTDIEGAPKVAVVNQAFARKFGLDRTTAVGSRMANSTNGELDIEIVGLVEDTKYSDVKAEIPPQFFTPYRQDNELGAIVFYVKTLGDPEPILPTLRKTVTSLDPNLPVDDLLTMELQIRENVFLDRFITTLAGGFALIATILAAIGLYGILAYSVAQRTKEFGLRAALGADAATIRRMIVRQVTRLTVPGALIGVAAALALGRLAGSMLFELQSHDPGVLTAAVLVLGATALLAALVPARRAVRTSPMEALRDD